MSFGKIRNRLSLFLWALVNMMSVGLFISTLMGFLGTWWWIFDLISHFRVQYLLGLLVLLLVYGIGKRPRSVVVTAVFVFVNLILILPLFIRPSVTQSEEQAYRILYANVRTENQQHDLIRKLIEETDPDFVTLLEVNRAWLDDLNLAEIGYPYSQVEARPDNFGVAFYSRFSLEQSEIRRYGHFDLPSVVAHLRIDDVPVTFIVTHPVPPKSESLTLNRNIQMSEISNFIAEQDGALILAGDLNATSWSPFLREWLHISQLRDSRRGFGVQPTWPTFNWIFLVPIDHILIMPDVQVHHREVGPNIGSDHYPLLLEFSLSDNDDIE